MNYSGKFSAHTPVDDTGAPLHGHFHVDSVTAHAPPGAIIVPDANLLFNGELKRSGVDLILSKDHQELVLQDYFRGEKRAALASPDGAHLTGDIINALTGYQQFAQAAGVAGVAKVIGHVSKLTGTATAIRNGVSIILNNGDNVEKGDVVQAGSNSTVGLTFIDGTVFGLSSNAKMVLNEMVYDPNGSNNSSLLSLVAGTISFVAGETAKHGDMKVDTPVATMGIRGTAVLVEIDFDVPAQGGAPGAKFQVLVEPDGTTGKYVLLDKLTQLPIATVDQAGVVKSISQGIIDSYSAPLTPDAQKLITDLFALKFTNVQDPTPKITTAQNDTVTPDTTPFFKVTVASFDPAAAPAGAGKAPAPTTSGPTDANSHVAGPPTVAVFGSAVAERANVTGSSTVDTTHGTVVFADINVGDRPTANINFDSFTYQNAQHNDVTATLTADQLAAIHAVEVPLVVVADPGNTNSGFATWTYNVADGAFDFLGAGETLTLTYVVEVNNNFAPLRESGFRTFTITVTGTNDAPTIATAGSAITERVGTGNNVTDTASGTVTFADVDLTDRPVVSTSFASFRYIDAHGHDVTATLTAAQLAAVMAVEVPLSVAQAAGNTNHGSATWTYSLTDKAFDFLAEGETLILNYVAQVDDGHGGVVSTPISVSVNGADVTIGGTNDVPTIVIGATTATGAVTEDTGAALTTAGTITYKDVDLTDTHKAAFVLKSSDASADLPGYSESGSLSQIGTFALGPVNENDADSINIGSVGWSFTLPDNDPVLQSLAVGQTITQVYTVTITDNNGGSVTQDVTVTITGTNDAPEITSNAAAASGAVTEDHDSPALSTGGTLAIRDLDLIDTHTASFVLTSSASSAHLPGFTDGSSQIGEFTIDPSVTENPADTNNGATLGWHFTLPDNDPVLQSLAEGQTITQVYTVRFDDHHGGTVTQQVTVVITGTNDAPTIDAELTTASGGVTEDASLSTLSTGGTIAFADLDLIDGHTASFVLKSSDASADLPGFTEGAGAGAANIGTFAVSAVNEDKTDTDNTGSLGWTFTLDDSNPVLQSLAEGQTITQVYTVTVADGHGGTVKQDVTVVITGTNDAPVVAADASGPHAIAERADTTGDDSDLDTASGMLAFTDVDLIDTHSFSQGKPTFAWSDSYHHSLNLNADQLGALTSASKLALTLHDSTGTGAGSVGFNYSAADSAFDFLAAGETLTVTYDFTVTDAHNVASTRPVTVTITGTNDAPVITSGPQTGAITEVAGALGSYQADTASGAVTFTDVDLNDVHAVTVTGVHASGITSGLPALNDILRGWLTLGTLTDSGNGATGSEPWTFSAPDHYFDYLAAGQTVTLDYTIQVDDHHGGTATQHIDITITGTNDAPVVAADASGPHVIAERTGLTSSSLTDTASGTLAFTDVDLADTHLSQGAPAFSWANSSGLTLSSSQQGALTMASALLLTLQDSTAVGVGSVGFNYSAADSSFDFLAAGETLTVTYGITVTDKHNAASTQPVTITVTGSNDTPVITSNPQTASIAEIAGALGSFTADTASGAVTFTDVDLSDIHTVTMAGVHASGVVSGLPSLNDTVAGWLTLGPLTDSVNGATGSEAWTFSAQDRYFDYLAVGETVTLDYAVQVADGHGGTATQHIDVTIAGAEDAPVITSGPQTGSIIERAGLKGSDLTDTAHGTVTFTDADRSDTHTVTVTGVTTSGAASGLPSDPATLQHWLTLGPLTDSVNGAPGSDAWTFSAPDKNFDYLRAGQTVTLTYTVQVADNHGGTTTQHIDVTITGTNDAPVILSETNPLTQTVIVVNPATPIVLAEGVNTNALGLQTENFNDHQQGQASNNGAGFGDFFSSALGATFAGSGHAGIVRGSSSVTAPPFIGPGVADSSNYLSIGAGGSETISFAHDQNAFGLYWGSVDSYNTIAFYHGTTLVASYTGADISPLFPTGNQGSFSSNGYVEFAGLASFDRVVLGSGNSNAFEIDNISAGTVPVPHVELGAPMTGTITVSDADIGDTLSASVVGNAAVQFHGSNGSTILPANASLAALISANAVTFDTAHSNGGTQVLHWTYDPTDPNLDFLKAGDSLTLTYTAQVNDGHGNVGSQPLTITIAGASPAANMSQFGVVNGTSGNDTFNHVGNNETVFGNGGHDGFVFNTGFDGATIGDFDINNDTISVDSSLFATVQAFVDAVRPANSNHDTTITDAHNDTITLTGVNAAQFKAHLTAHPSDFHII